MLKDLFQSIVDLSQAAKEPPQPKTFDPLCDPKRRRVAYTFDGQLHFETIGAPPIGDRCDTIPDFCERVETVISNGPQDGRGATIYVTEDGDNGGAAVVAVIGYERLDRIRLHVPQNPLTAVLSSWAFNAAKRMSQREAITFLRRDCEGTGFDQYADAIRNVIFDRSQQGRGAVARESESYGKSIEAKVSGVGDLPSKITGEVSYFDVGVLASPTRWEIGIDPLLQEELFEFWVPARIATLAEAEAFERLRTAIRDGLDDYDVDVIAGWPG